MEDPQRLAGAPRSTSLDLLWTLDQRPAKSPRPALTLAGIAEAAVQIADAYGIDAVSMQKVAERVGATKMALYRYVASKADLVAVMTETAVGAPPDMDTVPGGWRPKLLRQTWQPRRWLPHVTTGERIMGPKEIGWTEAAVHALSNTGLSGRQRMDAVFLLSGHVRNNLSSAGTQPWNTKRQLDPQLGELIRGHSRQFPALLAAIDDGRGSDGGPHDNGWSFGLQCILDGIEAAIARNHNDTDQRSES
jgi:AcrR family transcriptional regulator